LRRLDLQEHVPSEPVELSVAERDALHSVAPSIAISPAVGRDDAYTLRPSSSIGTVQLGDLQLTIRPKVLIERVFFLISYAVGRADWRQAQAVLGEADSIVEAVIPAFTYQLRRALARGVLQGYSSEEEAGAMVRGHWRISDQVSRRYGIAPPVEITFDDYTEDILANRLLRAAIARMLRLPVRDPRSTWGLRALETKLADVAVVSFDPRHVPAIRYDRLTDRYRPAVELARLILASASLELVAGRLHASSFLIDMNRVFEDFVVIALREALGTSDGVLVQGASGRTLALDVAGDVPLMPDISFWDGSVCTFVGDAKYKRVQTDAVPNDLYQLLAYTIATGLPSGTLIYAAGEEEPVSHTVVHLGKRLDLVALDLAVPPDALLDQIQTLATRLSASGLAKEVERLGPLGERTVALHRQLPDALSST
jgi:5-methylcytosine-specific restriction enzyme subunit McrC